MSFENGAQGVDIPPEIGSLKMYKKEWNTFDPETKGKINFTDLEAR